MRYKRKLTKSLKGFAFIVPLTIVIVIGFAVLAMGGYMVGVIGSTLEDTYPDNVETGTVDTSVWHNITTNASYIINLSSPNTAEQLSQTTSKFYIRANGSFPIYYNLTVNSVAINRSSLLSNGEGYNQTMAALITAGVSGGASTLTFQWDVNSTESNAQIRIYGSYYQSSDLRTANENITVSLIGTITDGFSDVVDIEIVVIIITALSMAIFAVMAVGSKRGYM